MKTFFQGCFGFIFNVIVNMTGFCYTEDLWHFIMKPKFNFKTILMFLASTFAVAEVNTIMFASAQVLHKFLN